MAQLISIKKVVVGPKNLTATVEFFGQGATFDLGKC